MNTDHDKNPKHWKLGIFYYNPSDPSLFVERKVGLGQDFNWAHRKSYLLFAFIILFPLLVILLPLYLLGYL